MRANLGLTMNSKLLLRIYGPKVEHLIDRDAELQILKRLARKRIGPRLLGTFTNGRFEEFFYARTLKPQDLRVPDTSIQIAKRMRELHEGIELLETERDGGPFVWRNWDKWFDRCGRIATWLDRQPEFGGANAVCGVKWPLFRKTVERYRLWLDGFYGGCEQIRNQLVFAHNDVSLWGLSQTTTKLTSHVNRRNTAIYFNSNLQANRHYHFPPTSIGV